MPSTGEDLLDDEDAVVDLIVDEPHEFGRLRKAEQKVRRRQTLVERFLPEGFAFRIPAAPVGGISQTCGGLAAAMLGRVCQVDP